MEAIVSTSSPRQLNKMGLKAEQRQQPYNVTWVDKKAQAINQCYQMPIQMFSYQDRV